MTGRCIIQLIASLLAILAFPCASGQPKVSGRISGGFEAPTSTDPQGRRHVLKGETAEPRGKDLYELTAPRVISYNAEDNPEMFIEAPRCFYETKENLAYSDASLSVRTADGRFSIEGLGWRWNPESANLIISNNVVALVKKTALGTNLPASRTAGPDTNAPVRITAKSFIQQGDTASFIDSVLVRDGPDTLRCRQLNLKFVKPDGIQVIEAVNDFEMTQEQTIIRSGRASYNLKENIIRILEKPHWESDGRSGAADSLTLNRGEGTILAEGAVSMKLPLTNLTETATNTVSGTNRFLEIFSDTFRFKEASSNHAASALYRGNVRALYSDATISSESIAVAFTSSNRVERIIARDQVKILSRGNQAFGQRAEYELAEDKIILTGDPHWELERGEGRSDTLVFYPKTREALALNNVEMIFEGQSVGGMFGMGERTNRAAQGTIASTSTPMVIRAESFARGTNIAVFNNNVVVADTRGRMSCDRLTLGFGATNQVQRILTEGSVRIEQPGLTATGKRGDYDASTGLVYLTGDPIIVGEGRTLRADAFIIDRNANTFSVAPGRYRIEMKMKKGAGGSLNPFHLESTAPRSSTNNAETRSTGQSAK